MKKNQPRVSTGQWVFLAIALVVVASIGLTVYNNTLADQRQKAAESAQKAEKEEADRKESSQDWLDDMNRTACLNSAQKNYEEYWDSETKALGITDGRLPEFNANRVDQKLKDDKTECYNQYGYN